jgi:hypothetical protein
MLQNYNLLTTLHLLINAAPYRAMLHLTELCCTSQSYAAPHRAMLHLTELHCTPLSYAVPNGAIQHTVNYAAPYWATQHPVSYAAPFWAMPYPTELGSTLQSYPTTCELRCTLLSYAVPHWATVHKLWGTRWWMIIWWENIPDLRNEKIHVYLREHTNYPWC